MCKMIPLKEIIMGCVERRHVSVNGVAFDGLLSVVFSSYNNCICLKYKKVARRPKRDYHYLYSQLSHSDHFS